MKYVRVSLRLGCLCVIYISLQEIDIIRNGLLDGGVQSSLNYYLAEVKDVNKEDNQSKR
jgi:hypothetical protein